METRGGAEDPQDAADRRQVMLVKVAEQHDVIGIERKARGHVAMGEPLKQPKGCAFFSVGQNPIC